MAIGGDVHLPTLLVQSLLMESGRKKVKIALLKSTLTFPHTTFFSHRALNALMRMGLRFSKILIRSIVVSF